MLSPKTKRNISRIIPFGVIWFLSGVIFLVVEKAASGGSSAAGAIDINFEIFIFSSIAITCVGLIVGAIELLYLDKLFVKKSFAKKMTYKIIIYISLLYLITIITFPIAAALESGLSIFDKQVWNKLYVYLTSMAHLSTDLQLAVALVASLLYSEISENIGHGILMNFFTGKYHTPKEEERIFMFLDMKSSTAIAEKLGHINYFELLREYYFDLSGAVIEHSGEIYQYVGDEIVVSWKLNEGIKNNNCIKCFFKMKEDLNNRSEFYKNRFGLIPTFKAGLHYGQVTTGEIGALKKEIIFTGDVLNATSRIQELCKVYNVDILISEDLYNVLDLNADYNKKELGKTELRGKKEKIGLYHISK